MVPDAQSAFHGDQNLPALPSGFIMKDHVITTLKIKICIVFKLPKEEPKIGNSPKGN
jgi:hypothetical protein